MDADLSHDPGAIASLRRMAEGGADVAIGSRYLDGVRVLNWPIARLLLSLGAAHYTRALTGMPLTDPTSGFKCFRRAVLEALDLGTIHSTGYSFQIEVNFRAWWAGFRLTEVPITFADRHVGVSKMSGKIAREAVFEVARLGLSRLFSRRRLSRSTGV
jgi:dolichol-phosphate mannosyltransferase